MLLLAMANAFNSFEMNIPSPTMNFKQRKGCDDLVVFGETKLRTKCTTPTSSYTGYLSHK